MNENISIRISDTQMFLKTSFLTWMLFIQNTNAYFSAGSIYPDLSMEFHRHFKPSPLCFQAQDLSSCALFLCLVSWEGSQVTEWYPPPSWFWSSFQMTLAHNRDHWLEHGTKDMSGELRKQVQIHTHLRPHHTCQLSLWWLPCINRAGDSLQICVPLLSVPQLAQCFLGTSTLLCRRHSTIQEREMIFENCSYFKLQTIRTINNDMLKQLSALSAPRTRGINSTL